DPKSKIATYSDNVLDPLPSVGGSTLGNEFVGLFNDERPWCPRFSRGKKQLIREVRNEPLLVLLTHEGEVHYDAHTVLNNQASKTTSVPHLQWQISLLSSQYQQFECCA